MSSSFSFCGGNGYKWQFPRLNISLRVTKWWYLHPIIPSLFIGCDNFIERNLPSWTIWLPWGIADIGKDDYMLGVGWDWRWGGSPRGRVHIYIPVDDSYWGMAEASTIVWSNYPPVNLKKKSLILSIGRKILKRISQARRALLIHCLMEGSGVPLHTLKLVIGALLELRKSLVWTQCGEPSSLELTPAWQIQS